MMQIRPGDMLPKRAIVHDGLTRWHALLVFPQREAAARAWLDARKVYSFYPVRQQDRVIRGKKSTVERRYLPGYLFARFNGAPIWHRILRDHATDMGSPFIRDAIRLHSGEPGVLMPQSLSALLDMRSRDEMLTEAQQARRLVKPGCRARVKNGAYQGQEVEVVTLTAAGGATFRLRMFGGEFDVEVDASRLERIEDHESR
jgi:transcription antitermination factor NusG